MNSYYPTKKTFFTALAAAILGVVLLSVFIVIAFGRINKYEKELANSKNYSKNIENASRIKNEINSLQADLSLIDSFFMHAGQEPIFIEKVEQLGRGLGLKISTDSVANSAASKKGPETLDLSLKYEGSLGSIISFLAKVEGLPYAVTLGDTSMTLVGSSTWSGTVKLSVAKDKS